MNKCVGIKYLYNVYYLISWQFHNVIFDTMTIFMYFFSFSDIQSDDGNANQKFMVSYCFIYEIVFKNIEDF